MTEVDWLLDQFAQVLDERDTEIAELRAAVSPRTGAHAAERVDPQDTDPGSGPLVTTEDEERSDA
jgi:hypothetical protein